MKKVKIRIDERGRGSFYIMDREKQAGEMDFSLNGNNLTVLHTEVSPRNKGRDLAKRLLAAVVEYARSHQLKVISLSKYVQEQFRRNIEEYADLWEKE